MSRHAQQARSVDVKVRSFPSRDREFAAFVAAAVAVLPEPRQPAALQRALRVRYPAAAVTEQAELARHGDGPVVWYAFRRAGAKPAEAPASSAVAAWAILDDDGRFVEISPALARVAKLPPRFLHGRRVEDVGNPADPTIWHDIGRLWTEFRSAGSLASTVRFNDADGRPRELAYRLDADAGGPGRHRLTVHVVEE